MSNSQKNANPQSIDMVLDKRAGQGAQSPAQVAGQILRLNIEELDDNPDQPRSYIDEDYIVQLAASIRANGLVHAISSRGVGGRYQIVAGHCRRATYRHLLKTHPEEREKWATVPAQIVELSDEQSAVLCVLENIEREELSAADEGAAYYRLQSKYGLSTAKALAERLGVEEVRVSRRLRLYNGPQYIRDAVTRGIKIEVPTEEGAPARKETRRLAFDQALEFLRLHAHLQKKYPGVEPRKANPRMVADIKGEPIVQRALAQGWSRDKVRDFVSAAIAGRAGAEEPSNSGPALAKMLPLVERRKGRLIIDLVRVRKAGAAEQAAARVEMLRLFDQPEAAGGGNAAR